MAFAPVENCSIDAVREAAARIAVHARVTPVLQSASIDRIAGASLHFKAEHLQRAGAFKFRLMSPLRRAAW